MKRMILLAGMSFLFCTCKKDEVKQPNASADGITKPADYLSAANYDKLTIEIQSEPGMAPTAATVDNLVTFLTQRLNKPYGVRVIYTDISSGSAVYNLSEIRNKEAQSRSVHTNGRSLAAYIVFLNADYSENSGNSKVLGISYGPSSMAIFEKTIRSYAGGLGQPSLSVLESTVIDHEFGHSLGLVNNGTEMKTQHQDGANGKHCNNSNCLMYYSVETSNIVANLIGNTVPSLDNNCIIDLQANGGK